VKRRILLLLGLLLAAIPLTATFALRRARATDPPAERVPVLLELFTSEGCSSCPPADDTLARLAREQSVDGAQIVPLAWHVDYWDSLGWPDPFSSAAFSDRQRGYASFLGRGSIYTPQAIVDGRAEMNGSGERALARAIADAARGPKARVSATVRADGDARVIDIAVGPLPSGAEPSEILVVVTQDHARVQVPRGENAGRTLDHIAIAREVRNLGTASSTGETRKSVRFTTVKPGSSIVIVVAEQLRRKVWGVRAVPLV
jgi:hypothetical protein